MWCTLVNADYAWPKIHLCPFRKMRTLWMCYEVISKSSPFTGSDIQLKIIFETGQDLKIRHQSTGCSKLGLVCWTFKKKKNSLQKKKSWQDQIFRLLRLLLVLAPVDSSFYNTQGDCESDLEQATHVFLGDPNILSKEEYGNTEDF